MGLNISTGNMYKFVSHTWNTLKGGCEHQCSYCYMKNYVSGKVGFKDYELRTNLGCKNTIFVGSNNDLFAKDVPSEWIIKTLDYCNYFDNTYLFQSKNPERILEFIDHPVFKKSFVCTTLESNRDYKEFMGNAPSIEDRVLAMEKIAEKNIHTLVTIEPIMDFDLDKLLELIKKCKPIQVNIGKNTSKDVKLPHPTGEKTKEFIIELRKFTKVEIKDNIKSKK